MNKTDVQHALNAVQVAERSWLDARTEFNIGVSNVMRVLLHEAARNYMSVEEIASVVGWSPKRVRTAMRLVGLDPRDGIRLLSQKAAEALANNASLMAIDPSEMDLLSPLAYLPMGDKMKRELQERTVSRVDEIPEEFGYDTAKRDIEVALLMGLDSGDLSPHEMDVEHLAAWLASEGIGKQVSGNSVRS